MKHVKALSKIIAKIDEEYERTHHLHKKKLNRLMRRAIKKAEALKVAIRRVNPLLNTKEVENAVDRQIEWMSMRRRERIGRQVQGA